MGESVIFKMLGDYCVYLGKRLDNISVQFEDNTDAEMIIAFSIKEMEIFRKHPDEYGYGFFIFQKNTRHLCL
jgi:hypothetical protein